MRRKTDGVGFYFKEYTLTAVTLVQLFLCEILESLCLGGKNSFVFLATKTLSHEGVTKMYLAMFTYQVNDPLPKISLSWCLIQRLRPMP